MQAIRLSIVLALLLSAVAMITQPLAYAQEKDVIPDRGVPGSTFAFYATGFDTTELVVFWALNPAGESFGDPDNRTYTNNEGRADWTWVAPIDAQPGTWTMIAQQVNEDEELIEDKVQQIMFEIVPIGSVDEESAPNVDAPNTETRSVVPSQGTPGSLFAFSATGFKGGERVGYWFNDPQGQIYSNDRDFRLWANDRGRADWDWAPPLDATPGTWQAVALGRSSGVQRVIFFDVVPLDQASMPGGEPDRGVEPAVAAPHGTFDFFATGFLRKETVSFWATDPTGRIHEGNEKQANEEGRADWNWRAPSDAQPGIWEMVVFGNRSEVTKIIRFEIRES